MEHQLCNDLDSPCFFFTCHLQATQLLASCDRWCTTLKFHCKQLTLLQAVTVDVLHSSGEIWVHDLRSIPWCDVGKSKTEPRFNMRRWCTKSTQLLWWALLRVLRGRAVVHYNHSWRWGTTRARTFHKHSTELLCRWRTKALVNKSTSPLVLKACFGLEQQTPHREAYPYQYSKFHRKLKVIGWGEMVCVWKGWRLSLLLLQEKSIHSIHWLVMWGEWTRPARRITCRGRVRVAGAIKCCFRFL